MIEEEIENLKQGEFLLLVEPDGLRIVVTLDRPLHEETEDEYYEWIAQ